MKAFVLSGGGALGAFEVGVMHQLILDGVMPDAIYGTSTGALNTVGYAYKGLSYLLKLWSDIKGLSDIFIDRGLLKYFYLLFGNGRGEYSSTPLEEKINAVIKGPASIKAAVCRVSLKTTAAEYVYAPLVTSPNLETTNNLMKKAVLSSASTPILNDVVDNEFVDGGLRHIAPLGQAINDGADEIYVILCEKFQENQSPNYLGNIGNVLSVARYTANTFVQGVLWNDVKICAKINRLIKAYGSGNIFTKHIKLHVYAPTIPIGDSLDFSPDHINRLIKYGEVVAPVLEDL